MSTPGYVYLLINYSMPGLAKVGRTDRAPSTRIDELSGATGVPTPFHLVFDILVPDAAQAESLLHAALEAKGYRTSPNREFFSAPLHEVVKMMLQVREAFESTSVARPLLVTTQEEAVDEGSEWSEFFGERDELFRQAAELCIRNDHGSTTLLQRHFKIGYGRAARIIDQLHQAGLLGPPDGSRPREVLIGIESLDAILGEG
jgi:hypothetical protein